MKKTIGGLFNRHGGINSSRRSVYTTPQVSRSPSMEALFNPKKKTPVTFTKTVKNVGYAGLVGLTSVEIAKVKTSFRHLSSILYKTVKVWT